MMLQEPSFSQYDLNFRVLGFPTRVTWGFWIAAIVLGWDWARYVDFYLFRRGVESPGAAALLLIWSLAILISILVHELGHALAMRYYGMESRVVLYHFGGLAIPESFGTWNAARRRPVDARGSILIAAAGPAAQIALAAVVYAIGRWIGMEMDFDGTLQYYLNIEPIETEQPSSAAAYALFNALVGPSFFWALLNLLPILPLDGGNIMLNTLLLSRNRDAHRNAYFVSMAVAILVGIYCLQSGQPMFGLMCLSFAASNWQMLQSFSGRF
jgi:stage IV sporulation protein FB